MSLNTTTNGEPIQTVYVYRYDYHRIEFGRGLVIPTVHYTGYQSCLTKPDIPDKPNNWNKNQIIETIKVDTTKMTARPIDDYFKKILFIWNDTEFKNNYNSWHEWIKQFEI